MAADVRGSRRPRIGRCRTLPVGVALVDDSVVIRRVLGHEFDSACCAKTDLETSTDDSEREEMKILIVDDSKAMRLIVRRQLYEIGLKAADFIEAANGVEGIVAIKEHHPDLVLSDWNMPEMNGIEMLEMLNAEGVEVKFGFVMSESQPTYKERAVEAGAVFVIAKPFNAETFKRALGQFV
jgi:two-component system chemotaxis response regulator CheY